MEKYEGLCIPSGDELVIGVFDKGFLAFVRVAKRVEIPGIASELFGHRVYRCF